MRAAVVVSLLVLLCAGTAAAQNAAPAPAASGIMKSQYLDRARERAAKRFDKLDRNQDGVLSAEERRTGHSKKRSPQQTGGQ